MILHYGHIEAAIYSAGVALENADRDIVGALNGGDAGLRYADSLGEVALGKAGTLTQSGQPSSQSQLVLDHADALVG